VEIQDDSNQLRLVFWMESNEERLDPWQNCIWKQKIGSSPRPPLEPGWTTLSMLLGGSDLQVWCGNERAGGLDRLSWRWCRLLGG